VKQNLLVIRLGRQHLPELLYGVFVFALIEQSQSKIFEAFSMMAVKLECLFKMRCGFAIPSTGEKLHTGLKQSLQGTFRDFFPVSRIGVKVERALFLACHFQQIAIF
jgi:hypothetical protein